MIRVLAVLCVAALAPAACASSSPTAPTGPAASGPRTGVWSGTVSDPVNGTGTIRIELSDYPLDNARSLLSGTWSTAHTDATKNGSGALSGTAMGATVALAMNPSTPPPCPPGTLFGAAAGSYISTALSQGATAITGSYLFTTCDGSASGTLDLRKQ
jgi:hypothetical protein